MSSPLERLRALCLDLPETTERLSHGEPTWFIRDKKVFVTYADRHHDDRVGFWCAAPVGEQEAQVAAAPDRFFRPPYVGGRGWLGIWLDVPVDWSEIEEIVREAYRQIAPKRLQSQLDASAASGED
ncbi:MAG: MmcQ/YjbR family DNA-binding protein [Geodermatophilaceae bacterium]|nr:MmcQ/YjbR family DNA-binding protein [Geodermatophilaceae bacterium]